MNDQQLTTTDVEKLVGLFKQLLTTADVASLLKLLTTTEVANMLNLSPAKVREIICNGKIKYCDLAGPGSERRLIRFRLEWVQEYIDSKVVERATPARRHRSRPSSPGDRY